MMETSAPAREHPANERSVVVDDVHVDAARSSSMIQVSPKWQIVMIGGAFIVINIIVVVAFVVVLILRN